MNAKDSKQVRAIKGNYYWPIVKGILERHGVSPILFVSYGNFFREINSKGTLALNKEAQKVRVGEIKAKYQGQGLKPEILDEIVRLVPLKT